MAANLGEATTRELFQEIIVRLEMHAFAEDPDPMARNTATQLSIMPEFLQQKTLDYRTVDQ